MGTERTAEKTLLVIEDNATTREGLARLLQLEGYQVVPAANGKEALDYLRQGPPPDLILLDMLMPVLDGWQFLRELRRDGPGSGTVPIILTTAVGITSREWAVAHGCAGFVRKPIQFDELLAEIQRC